MMKFTPLYETLGYNKWAKKTVTRLIKLAQTGNTVYIYCVSKSVVSNFLQ